MEVLSKSVLLDGEANTYTLNISISPSPSTFYIQYDGETYYNAYSSTIEAGTSVYYYIYHGTYGTTSGYITMDSDKTLTCTGTYSTTTSEASYSTPHNLTANGTIGGSSFAVTGSTTSTQWKAFDGNTTGTYDYWNPKNSWGAVPEGTYIELYYPTAVKIKSVRFLNRAAYEGKAPGSWTFYYSNDGSSWTEISSGTNTNQSKGNDGGTWTVTGISNSSTNTYYFHKYYKFTFGTDWTGTTAAYAGVQEMYPSAYYRTSSYTYYWYTSIT